MERKLAAIFYADVAGYSRLTGSDEEGTHRTLSTYLDAITVRIDETGGKVLHYAGDAILAEFPSVVIAVKCSIEVQADIARRNADIADNRKLQFRIGVNVGDVIADRGELYGDGVNVAARLESLAPPGGICISGAAFEYVKGKLDVSFRDMGLQQVKNIAEPVSVHQVLLEPRSASAAAPLPIPDRPSVAVMPFDNLTRDVDQEFFADGITDDIITGLSRFRSLFVIARNSTFTYKGRSIDVRNVARELGVRYILQGSVRSGGRRIRVTAQLVEAESGRHVWGQRYDHDMEDVFSIQDSVTESIVAAIAPEINEMERERAKRGTPHNLDAWGQYQRGLAAYHLATLQGVEAAIALFDEVNNVDPGFAPAFAMAADARVRMILFFDPADRDALLSQAERKARTATTLDAKDSVCLRSESFVLSLLGRHDIAVTQAEQAVALNPNDAQAWYRLAYSLGSSGRPEEAIPHIDNAIRLSPHDAELAGRLTYRAFILFDLERYDEAYAWSLRASRSPNPRTVAFETVVASLVRLGRREETAQALNDYLAHKPDASLEYVRSRPWIARPDAKERYVAALREAGVPEKSELPSQHRTY